MSFGSCDCVCSGGGGGGGHPPPGHPPDPGWTSGYYAASKYARVARDGFPDLRYYFRGVSGATGTVQYDSGIRYLNMDWLAEIFFLGVSESTNWTFYQGAEQVVVNYLSGGVIVSSAGEFTPNSPAGTANGIVFARADDGGPFGSSYPTNATVTAGLATGLVNSFPSSAFTATGSNPVPETLLDDIEDKLNVQFLAGASVALQLNPANVIAEGYSDGPRTGVRYRCASLPSYPAYFGVQYSTPAAGSIWKAFSLDYWSQGTTTNLQSAFTGLRLKRDKQMTQFGSKASAGTVLKTYRKFTVPTGFNIIIAAQSSREPSAALAVNGGRLPANSSFVEEVEISLAEDTYQTFNPDAQEVYYFDGRPYSFPTTLPSVSEVLTPLPAKKRLYRKTGTSAIALRWCSEDRCLHHELYRKVNAGSESLILTLTTAPEYIVTNPVGWSGFTDPDTGFVQFPLGYEWQYSDTAVSGGNTYTYRLKSYYDTSYKSAYSASYSVTL